MKLQSILDEMARIGAWSVLITSGKKVELQLASGSRYSREPVAHDLITQMLLEVAPPAGQAEIRVGRAPAAFHYHYNGSTFSVQVDAFRDRWSVAIAALEADDDPNVIDFGSVGATAELAGSASGGLAAAGRSSSTTGPNAAAGSSAAGVSSAVGGSMGVSSAGGGSMGVSSAAGGSTGSSSAAGGPSAAGAGARWDVLPSDEPALDFSFRPPEIAPVAPVGRGGVEAGRAPEPARIDNDFARAAGVLDELPRGASGDLARPAAGVRGTDPRLRSLEERAPEPVADLAGRVSEPPWAETAKPAGEARARVADPPWGSDSAGAAARPAGAEPRINAILRKLLDEDGSDVHFTAGMAPRFRIDGSIHPMNGLGVLSDTQIRDMLVEIMPGRNRRELDEIHDTDFAHAIEGVSRFRVNVGVDRHGIFSVIRRIPFQIMSPEQIGLPRKVLDLCWLTKGLVLVTGPTGSGKSTTLATLIDFINTNRQDHIITIEDPIEFVHPDTKKCLIRQRQVGEHTGSFKRALKAALREDPDIVLVGEMRDLETIEIAIETAETGHLVFGTLHTTTAASTVDRIIDQFPSDRQEQIRVMLSESLKGVISQTLCKRTGGGRVAAYEVLLGTKAISNLIREGKTFQIHSILQTSKNAGMCTMAESLFNHVRSRSVTPEEAYMKAVDKDELRGMLDKAGIRVNLRSLEDL